MPREVDTDDHWRARAVRLCRWSRETLVPLRKIGVLCGDALIEDLERFIEENEA